MNTTSNNQSAEASATASLITEQQVVAFMRQKAGELAAKTGRSYSHISIEQQNPGYAEAGPVWTSYSDEGTHCRADSVDAAIAAQLREFSPERQAARLRSQAAELLAKAEALSPAPIVAA